MRAPLTRQLIGRAALRIFTTLPWQVLGSAPFIGRAGISVPISDLNVLTLDDFVEKYIEPVTIGAARTRGPAICPEWDEDEIDLDSTRLRMFSRYDRISDSMMLVFNFDYTPPVPDFGMPIYFWLGEQSDVA